MPRRTRARTQRARPSRAQAAPAPGARTVRELERRLARLTAAAASERARHERQIAAARRAADRRLAGMVAEIAALRHHEARAEALARLLAERDAALGAQAERIAALEALLRSPTQLG